MEPRPTLALPFSKPCTVDARRGSVGQFSREEAGDVIKLQFLAYLVLGRAGLGSCGIGEKPRIRSH
ncbi:MAG: hypothetical protein C0511_07850 [Hyphomicrobium sp.]|nr:hypothetical protein [Hyphomicrobium sp.]